MNVELLLPFYVISESSPLGILLSTKLFQHLSIICWVSGWTKKQFRVKVLRDMMIFQIYELNWINRRAMYSNKRSFYFDDYQNGFWRISLNTVNLPKFRNIDLMREKCVKFLVWYQFWARSISMKTSVSTNWRNDRRIGVEI